MKSKQDIRKEMAIRRRALEAKWVETASTQVIDRFQRLTAFQSAATVGLYLAIGGEVNLDPLFESCRADGRRTCIPWFNPATRLYEMVEITSLSDCAAGHHGIREPRSPAPFPMEHIDIIAVPGVAFDRKGCRLGRGGGYYDRLLAGFQGVAAATAFDFQLLPSVPSEPHDRPVDLIVTDLQLVNV